MRIRNVAAPAHVRVHTGGDGEQNDEERLFKFDFAGSLMYFHRSMNMPRSTPIVNGCSSGAWSAEAPRYDR